MYQKFKFKFNFILEYFIDNILSSWAESTEVRNTSKRWLVIAKKVFKKPFHTVHMSRWSHNIDPRVIPENYAAPYLRAKHPVETSVCKTTASYFSTRFLDAFIYF